MLVRTYVLDRDRFDVGRLGPQLERVPAVLATQRPRPAEPCEPSSCRRGHRRQCRRAARHLPAAHNVARDQTAEPRAFGIACASDLHPSCGELVERARAEVQLIGAAVPDRELACQRNVGHRRERDGDQRGGERAHASGAGSTHLLPPSDPSTHGPLNSPGPFAIAGAGVREGARAVSRDVVLAALAGATGSYSSSGEGGGVGVGVGCGVASAVGSGDGAGGGAVAIGTSGAAVVETGAGAARLRGARCLGGFAWF